MENTTLEEKTQFPEGFPPPQPLKKACRKCLRLVEEGANYCPHCGARQGGGEGWYYSTLWILVLSLVILGPFGLFLVWKSPRMGRTAKWIMAGAILAYSIVGIYISYELIAYDVRKIRELMEMMGQIRGR